MRRLPLRLPPLFALLVGCGSATGLKVPEFDSGTDTSSEDVPLVDVPLVDVPLDALHAERDGRTPSGCFTFNTQAGSADLDIFLLMDNSMSMDERVAGGASKIEAVTEAIDAFVRDGTSRGLNIALTSFPTSLLPTFSCTLGEECPGGIPCVGVGRCELSNDRCTTAPNQCSPSDTCIPNRVCHNGLNPQECSDEEPTCRNGNSCIPNGVCADNAFCSDWAYRRPRVALAPLPEAGASIVAALGGAAGLRGSTPTLPALRGVIETARMRLAERPERQVLVLVATDGLPSSCDAAINFSDDSLGMVAPAAAAAAGAADGIQTFVVGVFRPVEEDSARRNLTTLAEAGGSIAPFVVSTTGSVADELREAFTEVRLAVQTCAYAIPAPRELPERENIRVRFVDEEDVVEELGRVGGAAECGPGGGFYFRDEAPRPSVVELCPSSCELRTARDYKVLIEGLCPPEG